MKNKAKLAFEMLEREMELIDNNEMTITIGGMGDGSGSTGSFDGRMDCVFRSIAFVTGESIQDVQNDFVSFYNKRVDDKGWNPIWHTSFDQAGASGVSDDEIVDFFSRHGISQGYSQSSPFGSSSPDSNGIVLIPGHAFNITGMSSPFEYYYYDMQTGGYGTIAINDPRIIAVFSKGGAFSTGNIDYGSTGN